MTIKKIIFGLSLVVLAVVVLVGVVFFIFFNNTKDFFSAFSNKHSAQPAAKTVQPKTTDQILAENNIQFNKKIEDLKAQPAKRPVITKDDHIWGSLKAPVKIVVYSDFTCPFCRQFYETSQQIKEKFGDQVVIAFRYFPLPSHQGAFEAALAAECAAEQGKFWPMYNKLFADNKEHRLTTDQYLADAKGLALNISQFSQCLKSKKYKEKIARSYVEGKGFDVLGTPTVFVDNEIYPGAYPFADFVGPDGQKRPGMENIIKRHLKNINSQ